MAMAATYRFIPKQTAFAVYYKPMIIARLSFKIFSLFCPQTACRAASSFCDMNTYPCVSIHCAHILYFCL